MYCRNCANEVSDKAIACPKCGVNPRSEKKYCMSCGTATNANQVVCTSCGVSLASASPFNLDGIKLPELKLEGNKDVKTLVAAAIAIVGYFATWLKISSSVMGMGGNALKFSGSGLTGLGDKLQSGVSSFLIPQILYLFPICVLAFVIADYLPPIAKYKKLFCMGALVLVVYALISILTMGVDVPEGSMLSGMDLKMNFSLGFGLYLSVLGTVAMSFFYGLFTKK